MEYGTSVEAADFFAQCGTSQPVDIAEVEFGLVPSLQEIEEVLRAVPKAKAHGLDCLPAELFSSLPTETARLFAPLFMKATLTCTQPSQWHAGILFEAYKGKGCAAELASFRSLYISSIPATCLHRVWRNKLRPVADATFHSLHCGVVRGRPVTLPTLTMKLLVSGMKRQGVSCAIFFLDSATAYYSIVRELALGPITGDAQVMQILQRFGLGADDVRDLSQLVQQGGLLQAAGVGEHLTCILRNMYSQAWFVTRFCTGAHVCHTRLGSRPGSTFADLSFAWVYHRILNRIRGAAAAADLTVQIPHDGTRCPSAPPGTDKPFTAAVLDTTWADDTAAVTADADPRCLVTKASRLAALVIDQCRSHGLSPNLKKGKSAVMIALRGCGSRTAAREAFEGNKKTLPAILKDGSVAQVHVEAAYIHLGTLLDRDGSFKGEAKRRLAMAARAFDQLRSVALQNVHIDPKVRAMIFQGAVGSSLFNLELWSSMDPAWTTLRTGFWRMQRRTLARVYRDEAFFALQTTEVLQLTHMLPLEIIACKKRLGFVSSLAQHASEDIWALIQWEGCWSQKIRRDFEWLVQWSDSELPSLSHAAWPLWWHVLRRPSWVKNQARIAARRCWESRLHDDAVACFLFSVFRQRFGARILRPAPQPGYCCPLCTMPFKTRSGLGAHYKKIHSRFAAYRYFGGGTVCRACGKDYFDEQRLLKHLRHAKRCRGVMATAGYGAEVPQGSIASWDRSKATTFILCPPQRAIQPCNIVPAEDWRWKEQPLLQQLYQKVLDWLVWFESADEEELRQGILALFKQVPLYDDEFRMVAAKLLEAARILVEDEALNVWQEVGHHKVYQILADFAQHFRATVFLPTCLQEEAVRPDVTHLLNGCTWTISVTERPVTGRQLCVNCTVPFVANESVDRVDEHTALRMWETSKWCEFDRIVWKIVDPLKPEAFFGARLRLPEQAEVDAVPMLLLSAVSVFLGQGGQATVCAGEWLWSSHLCLPLAGVSRVVSP